MEDKQLAVSAQPSAMKLDERIMQFIPLMAPVPTAWMIGTATFTIMHFPLPVSVISALTVEGLGFVSINTANEMREFNRHLNGVELKQKMQAPVWQAGRTQATLKRRSANTSDAGSDAQRTSQRRSAKVSDAESEGLSL